MAERDRIRVLHVEDDPEFADLVSTYLQRADDRIDVTHAPDGSSALEQLSDRPVECVVSDYEMPGMDGIELLEVVRERWSALPFVLFTAKGSEAVASDAISAGVTDYLQKGSGTGQYDILAHRICNAVERRRAQRERQRNLEAIERAQEGIAILDQDGHFVFVNDAYADLYGYDRETLVGEHWEMLYREADVGAIHEDVLPVLEDEGQWHGQTTGLRADGSTFPEEHTLSRTAEGQLVCTVRDVTEREERKRRLETLIDNLPGMVYRCHNEPGWPMENLRGEVEALTGYPAGEIERSDGMYGEEIIHPEDRERVWERVQSAIDTEESFELTYRIQTAEGETRWVWEQGQAVVTDGTAEALEGFITDITEKKATLRALRTERALVDQALDTLSDLFYVLNPDGTLDRWNDALGAVSGYEESEIESMHATDFVAPADRDRLRSAIEETIETGEVTFEAAIETKAGEEIPYEFTGDRVTDPEGAVTGIVGVGRRIDAE